MNRKRFLQSGVITLFGLPLLLKKNTLRGVFTLENADELKKWLKTGGPIGGLGYNVRYRPDSPSTIFVTDAWSGLQKSTDGGENWSSANSGISFRNGPSSDAIPIFAFKVDSNNNDILWAGTQNGGGLYKSTDGGDTWVKKDTGINLDPNPDAGSLTIRHIEVEPGNSNTVYVMGEMPTGVWGTEFERVKGFIYRSTDGGENFSLLKELNSLTRWMFIDPSDTDSILVTTGIFDRESDIDDPNETHASGPGIGVYISNDGGSTWISSNTGMDSSKSLFVGGADRDPDNPSTHIVATGNNNDFNKGIYGAVYRTTDGDQNWTDVSPNLPVGILGEVYTAVAFAPSDPDIVYVGSAIAIYRSSDNGLTWQRFTGGMGAPYGPKGVRSGVPIDMVVDPNDPDTLFINNYGGGVFKSTDGAQTWISWSKGYTGADIHSVTVHPSNSLQIMANGRSGVFLSDDAGENWQGISNGYAAFPEGFGVAYDPSDLTGKTLLCSDEHESYILRSTDNGNNWTPALYLETGEVNNRHGARNIRFAPSNADVVYAGFMAAGLHADPHKLDFSESLGIYKSSDGGQNWNEANTGLPTGAQAKNVTDIAISYQSADKLYITLRSGGVYRSLDGGSTWQDLKTTLPDGENWTDEWGVNDSIQRHSLLSCAVHPNNDEIILVGGNIFGIYKSVNGGSSWSQVLPPTELINNGTRDHGHIFSVVFDPNSPTNVYAAEWHGGMYKSEDSGESWSLINDGLSTRAVAKLSISSNSEYLYAATQGEGVFRYQIQEIATSISQNKAIPNSVKLHQNYPNPFNPSTTISFELNEPGNVKLTIFNSLGQTVKTLFNGYRSSGSHSISFDATSFASGTYIYKLEGEGFSVSKKMILLK
ncbi:MAG: T9SS type A sorting domain-containing protein [Balneola sp.]